MFHAAFVAVLNKGRVQNAFAEEERAPGGTSSSWLGALPGIMSFAVVSVVGYSGGGIYPRTWRLSMLALLAVAAAALIARERITVSRREWAMAAALAALTAWTAASYYWSRLPNDSLVEAERTLLYVVAFAAFVLGVTRASLPSVLIGSVAGITAVSAYALGQYVFHPLAIPDPFQGWHLFQPFGYANAIGIYVVLGIVLAVGLALWARSPTARLAALSPLLILLPTLYYTASRGAWVALPVGIVAMLYLGRRIPSRGALVILLAAGVLAGVVIGSDRGQKLSVLGELRPTYWRIAWEDVETNPYLGSGAGTFGDFLLEQRTTPYYAHDAHSLYLEALAELGAVGLVLLAVALAIPLAALRGRKDPLVAAAGGVYVAFLLHAGVDWDWEFSAVTVTGLLCGAAVLVGTRPERSSELSRRGRIMLLVAILLVSVLVVVRLNESGQLGL